MSFDQLSPFSQFRGAAGYGYGSPLPPLINSPEPITTPPLETKASSCAMTLITSQSFEEQFADCRIFVEQDSSEFLKGRRIESLVTSGVGSCLMLAIRGINPDGKPSFCGIGHFSYFLIDSFLENRRRNDVKEYLDKAARLVPAFDVFAAGMYDNEKFNKVCDLITANYSINKFEVFSNPWAVELKDRLYDDDFVRYLEEKDYALRAGMTETGELFIADQSVDSNEDGFGEFSEEDFEQWKHKRRLQAMVKAFQLPRSLNQSPRSNGSSKPLGSRLSTKRKLSYSDAEEKLEVTRGAILESHKKRKTEFQEDFSEEVSSIKLNVIAIENFNKIFDPEKILDVEGEEFEFLVGEDIAPLMTTGVCTCFALVVRSFDQEGNLLCTGVGRFAWTEVSDDVQNSMEEITQFLDKAKKIISEVPNASFEIVAAGMHDKDFTELKLFISSSYKPTQFNFQLLNPWNIPADRIERPDSKEFNDYIDDWGGSLRIGITENGEIYVADERLQPSDAPGFLQFSEEAFDAWKANQAKQKPPIVIPEGVD